MGEAGRNNIALVGAGAHAKVVLALLEDAGYAVEAVFDDDPRTWGQTLCGAPVVGSTAELSDHPDTQAVIAIGDNRARSEMARRFKQAQWISVVHPSAYVHRSVRLGPGAVVCAGAVIQPEAVIGSHAIVNTAASVDHECSLADCVHLAPGVHLAGRVQVQQGALLGIGCVVKPGISIGEWSTVGAGGVVVRDVSAGTTVVGVPAKPMQRDRAAGRSPSVSERERSKGSEEWNGRR